MTHSSSPPASQDQPEVLSVSLGMLVIDEIRTPSHPPLLDVAGGSGAYAPLGHRLFTPTTHSPSVGILLLAGHDFPAAILAQLATWDATLVVKVLADKLSTRGLLEYTDSTFGPKTFHYTTPPLKPSPTHLPATPFLRARTFHMLATPQEISAQVPELLRLREDHGIREAPYIVWEPLPAACTTENREMHMRACRWVNVFSPNHHELRALFEDQTQASPPESFHAETLERHALEFAKSLNANADVAPWGNAVVVRAAEHGSLTICPSTSSTLHLPSYHAPTSPLIIDPTGAGNAFLGGFIAGMLHTQNIAEASMYGHVAASFAIEQVGLPRVGVDGGREVWNGVEVRARLEEHRRHVCEGYVDWKRMEVGMGREGSR